LPRNRRLLSIEHSIGTRSARQTAVIKDMRQGCYAIDYMYLLIYLYFHG